MALLENNPKQIKKVNIKFFCFLIYCVFLILFFLLDTNTTEAQEYATDRLFIKQYKKTKCKNEAEQVIKKIKKTPEMTLEQEVLLIRNIWVKLRSNLPLSPGEKKLLKNLKEKLMSNTKLMSNQKLM